MTEDALQSRKDVVEGKDELGEAVPVHGPVNLTRTTHSGRLLDAISQRAAVRVGSEISYPSLCRCVHSHSPGVPDRRLCLKSAVLASATSARGLPAKDESCFPCSGERADCWTGDTPAILRLKVRVAAGPPPGTSVNVGDELRPRTLVNLGGVTFQISEDHPNEVYQKSIRGP